jgi:hypothetical protein
LAALRKVPDRIEACRVASRFGSAAATPIPPVSSGEM